MSNISPRGFLKTGAKAVRSGVNSLSDAVNSIGPAVQSFTRATTNFALRGDAPLRYPLDWEATSKTTDQTSYWIHIQAQKQQVLKSESARGLGVDTSVVTNENAGIIDQHIWLYLPQMQQSDNMNYETPDLGFFGRSVVELANTKGTVGAAGQAIGESLDQAASAVVDIYSGQAPSVGTIAAGIGIADKLGSIGKGVGDIASRAYGISKDPHTISLFKSVQLRKHEFNFTFVPKSEAEAREVQEIIKFFRLAVYPIGISAGDAFQGDFEEVEGEEGDPSASEVQSTTGGINLAYIHPNTFKLAAYFYNPDTGSLEPLSKKGLFYHECVLESINVNFDPTNELAARPGGHFPSSTMSLTFSEIETLRREDIREFYK